MAEGVALIREPTTFAALVKIHTKPVLDCCFSPDTDQIVTSSEDSTVVLWNLPPSDLSNSHDDAINNEGQSISCTRMLDHDAPVMSIAMDRRLILSASKDGRVKIWKLERDLTSSQRKLRKPIPGSSPYNCHRSIIRSIAFSPEAKCFATGADDKSVKLWSTECRNKMLAAFLDGHTNWIKCVRWCKTDEYLLASCGDDGKICIWDTRTRVRQEPLVKLTTRRRIQFNCLDWHPIFQHHIATGAQDSSCVIWDLRNRKQVQVYLEHNGSVNSLAFNSGGSLLLTGSSDRTSNIFDVCEGRSMFKLKSHSGPVTSVCFNGTSELLATGSHDKTVRVWRRNFDTIKIIPYYELAEFEDNVTNEEDNDDTNVSVVSGNAYHGNMYSR